MHLISNIKNSREPTDSKVLHQHYANNAPSHRVCVKERFETANDELSIAPTLYRQVCM